MNLLINNYCNLKCSYCFAQEEMHSKEAMNITMENFCKYLDFLKKNNDKHVRLIGGEPTLHPNLEGLLNKVIEYDYFDDILIFTNLTFSHDIAEMLINYVRSSFPSSSLTVPLFGAYHEMSISV